MKNMRKTIEIHILKMVVALVSVALMLSCGGHERAQMDRAYSLMDEAPDSALALLSMCNKERLSKSELARYALLYTMAQDKSGLNVDDDSLIRIAYDYYKKKTEDSLYAKSQYYMGKYFMFNDSIKDAELCYTHAIEKSNAVKDYNTAYMACYHLSRSLAYSNPTKAIKIAKEGLHIQEVFDSENTINHIYMLVNIGNSYLYQDENKKQGISYIQQAKDIAITCKDASATCYSYRSLSTCYMSLGMRDSALYYVEKAIGYSSDINLKLLYAANLYDVDSISKSKVLFEQIANSTSSPNILYTCYRYLSKTSSIYQDNENTILNLDSAYSNMERMYEDALQLRNDYYETTIQKEKANTALVEKSKKKDIFIIIGISVGLLALAFFTLLYRVNKKEAQRKLQHEQQRHQLQLLHQEEERRREHELEEQKHKLELESAEKRYQDELATRELQLNLMRDHLLSKLAIMKKFAHTKDDNKAIRISDDDWREIETFLNGTDNLFVERIKADYPDLTKKDLQFCMLLRLKCSTLDLMNIYCINEQSIKQKKYKFKTKLGITDSQISAKQFVLDY